MTDSLEQHLTFFSEGMKNLQGLKTGYAYASLYEYALAKGRSMESRALSPEQKRYLVKVLRREGGRYPMKECFSNSQRVFLCEDLCEDFRKRRLAYYEGYATSGMMPVLHGWLVLDGECVIDLTWRRREGSNDEDNLLARPYAKGAITRTRVIGKIPDGYGYFGLEVASRDAVLDQMRRTKSWRCFLDNWEEGYPLLRTQVQNSQQSA